MPEGDTIYRSARTLDAALSGRPVQRFTSGLVQLSEIDRTTPIAGQTIDRVTAVGKHLLMWLSGGLVLRTHMRMNGSWHVYRPGERWQRPAHAMRILLETSDWVAVAFNVHSAEFVRAEAIDESRSLRTLGPDLLADFDVAAGVARAKAQGARPLHEVLLDQRVVAGLGNVYKSELLFLTGHHPDTAAAALADSDWSNLFVVAQKLLQDNVREDAGAWSRRTYGARRTTGRLDPNQRLWVYGRSGQPCRRCGAPISFRKDGEAARVTYWCPACQT